jgi:hypothetical protein
MLNMKHAGVPGIVAVAVMLMAATAQASLLQDHFGVNPALGSGLTDNKQNATTYPFVASSLVPTKNVGSTEYVVDDWQGEWSDTTLNDYTDWNSATHPSGEEPYDVEAIYFDCDNDNLYIAVLTSFGPATSYYEDRDGVDATIVAGDLALDFSGTSGGPYNGAAADGFHYDFGVDITNDQRPSSGNAGVRDSTVGTGLYRTDNSDWYVGTATNATDAGGEDTNFDPIWDSASTILNKEGDATVTYENLAFYDGDNNEIFEMLHPTYVVEVTIARSLLPELQDGDIIGISWVEGCRNDGNSTDAIVRLDGEVPEPATLSLLAAGALALLRKRRRGA